MTNQRISVAKPKHLMQFESSELTMREIGRALQLSAGAVSKYRCAVRKAGLTWDEAQHLTDTELERRVWQARAARQPRHWVDLCAAFTMSRNQCSLRPVMRYGA